MARVFAKSNYWILKFAFCFLLSACIQAGHVTIDESIKHPEAEETEEAQEALIILAPAKPLKSHIPPLVLLLDTHESEQYELTTKAFKEHLANYLPEAEYMYHLTDSEATLKASQFLSPKTKSPPAIVVSLGTSATGIAQTVFPDTPILAIMTLQGNMLPHNENSAAILLEVPIKVQLQWIKKFLPNARRVGILYDPAINTNWIEEAENIAQDQNLEIIPYKINSPKQLQEGLRYIKSNADILLAIPDKTVYTGITVKEIMLFGYRNRLPLVGLSDSWVNAGALYAIEVDYENLGIQTAGLAASILTAGFTGKRNIIYPEGVNYSLNMRTKNYLGLEIANDFIEGASKIFE